MNVTTTTRSSPVPAPVGKHCNCLATKTSTSPPREAGSLTMDSLSSSHSHSHHQPLGRATSTESTAAISTATATATWQPGRKAQASEPQMGTESIEVKLSPYGTDALAPLRPLGLTARRPSKASDHLRDYFGRTSIGGSGSAIDEEFEDRDNDVDATPLAGGRYPSAFALASSLSSSEANTKSRSDVDSAEKRLSFSSLYSIGSAIYANTRGHSWSGRSSVVGSEPDCQSSRRASHWAMARVHH